MYTAHRRKTCNELILALMRRYQQCRSMTIIGCSTMLEIVIEIGIRCSTMAWALTIFQRSGIGYVEITACSFYDSFLSISVRIFRNEHCSI